MVEPPETLSLASWELICAGPSPASLILLLQPGAVAHELGRGGGASSWCSHCRSSCTFDTALCSHLPSGRRSRGRMNSRGHFWAALKNAAGGRCGRCHRSRTDEFSLAKVCTGSTGSVFRKITHVPENTFFNFRISIPAWGNVRNKPHIQSCQGCDGII